MAIIRTFYAEWNTKEQYRDFDFSNNRADKAPIIKPTTNWGRLKCVKAKMTDDHPREIVVL